MLTSICAGIWPEDTCSQKMRKILLSGGTISGLIHCACATISHAANNAPRNKTPFSRLGCILGRFPRGHATVPAHRPRFDDKKQPIKRVAKSGDQEYTAVHGRAVHRAFFVENEKAQALAAGDHLGGRDQKKR